MFEKRKFTNHESKIIQMSINIIDNEHWHISWLFYSAWTLIPMAPPEYTQVKKDQLKSQCR